MVDCKVLIVSPHPDDESLGAAGTLLKYKDLGAELYWLNITNIKSEYGYNEVDVIKKRQQMSRVHREIGFKETIDLELRPAFLDTYRDNEIITIISGHFKKILPNVLILPYRNDIHSDHKRVHDWCIASSKSFRHPSIKKIMLMEILSETEFSSPLEGFLPNMFVDISNYMEKKRQILSFYDTEMASFPFPRSIDAADALAKFRGVRIGKEFAEAFVIHTEIE